MEDLFDKLRNGIYKKGKAYGIIFDVALAAFMINIFAYIIGTGLAELVMTGL